MDTQLLPQLWRRATWILGTIFAVVAVGFSHFALSVVGLEATGFSDVTKGFLFLGIALIGVALAVSLCWRRSRPVRVLVLNLMVVALLPLSPLGILAALPWVIASQTKRTAVYSSVAAGAVTGLSLVKDARAKPELSLFTFFSSEPHPAAMPWWGYLLVWAGLMFIAVSVGLIRRFLNTATVAHEQVVEQQVVTASLRGELSRKEERELIAREMHDTVAHQLSLISMQAGVLEVTTSDPTVPDSARIMRESVHTALEEMRAMISSLRDSQSEGYTGVSPNFESIETLLAQAREAGARVNADLQYSQDLQPSQRLTNAVYRIVQESLTNAIKYGTQEPIWLRVYAGPSIGVFIDVINEIAIQPGTHTLGTNAGLSGMQERATLLDGTMTYAQVDTHWRVTVQLPWSTL